MSQNISKREFLKRGMAAAITLIAMPVFAKDENTATIVDADELVKNIDAYTGKDVEITGEAIHICPVNSRKLKFKTAQGNIIKVIFADSKRKFDKELNHKQVRITGKISELRVSCERIMQHAKDVTLRCHIDYTPCTDKEWIKNMFASGRASKYSENETAKLNEIMQKTDKNYISVVIISARELNIVG